MIEKRRITVKDLKTFIDALPDHYVIVVGAEGSFSIPDEELIQIGVDHDDETLDIVWDDTSI